MLLLIGSAWRWTTASDAVAGDASLFMNQLWGQTVEVLSKKIPGAERLTRFRQLYLADFDGPGIARFVLGRYWRSASKQEQHEFLKLFEDYVFFVYGTRLSNFSSETSRYAAVEPTRAGPSFRLISSARTAMHPSRPIGDSSPTTTPSRSTTYHRRHQDAGDAQVGIRLGDSAAWRSSRRSSSDDVRANEDGERRGMNHRTGQPQK